MTFFGKVGEGGLPIFIYIYIYIFKYRESGWLNGCESRCAKIYDLPLALVASKYFFRLCIFEALNNPIASVGIVYLPTNFAHKNQRNS